MELAAISMYVLALVVAVIATPLAIYNFFLMIREIRPTANWWVNLVPYLAFALPGSLTPLGGTYRARFSRWMFLALAAACAAFGMQLLYSR